MTSKKVEGLGGGRRHKRWSVLPKSKDVRKQNATSSACTILDLQPTATSWSPLVDDSTSTFKNRNHDADCVGLSSVENTIRVVFKSRKQQQARKKNKVHDSLASRLCSNANSSFNPPSPIEEEVEEDVFYDSRSSVSLQQLLLRSELEDEVSTLHKQLKQQQELHAALEKALRPTSGILPNKVPSHLPAIEQKLLLDIAILEVEVLNLEMQISGLQWRLVQESVVDEVPEQVSPVGSPYPSESPQLSCDLNPAIVTLKELLHIPCPVWEEVEEDPQSPSPPRRSFWSRWNGQDLLCRSARPSLRKQDRFSLSHMEISASVTPKENQHSVSDGKCAKCSKSRVSPVASTQEKTSHFSTLTVSPQEKQRPSSPVSGEKVSPPLCILSPGDHLKDLPEFLLSAKRHLSFWSNFPNDHSTAELTSMSANFISGELISTSDLAGSPQNQQYEKRSMHHSGGTRTRELQSQGLRGDSSDKSSSTSSSTSESFSSGQEDFLPRSESQKSADEYLGFPWSKEARSANKLSEEMLQSMAKIYCDLSNTSKGSLLITGNHQSPTSHLANLRAATFSLVSESLTSEKIVAHDATSDPYKAQGKLSWVDVGPYNHALEVRWLSVGKEQLECAAHALGKFRLLVEQLQHVDPQIMTHDQKLAFWINVYNSLLMHAFLAYGVPRSDLKFFNLMQKAAYCVGGQWVNAALIECCLLKGKAMAHRPQFGIMNALHKHKLKEELIKYGIEQMEPLVNFALCCGAQSSPMVRVYTAEHVHEELEFALHDYARAAVGISGKGKLLVPKLLYCYAHEIVDDRVLLDWVCDFLPTSQVGVIFKCIQQRRFHFLQSNNNFAVLPFDFSFRYLFPPDVSKKLDVIIFQ